MLIVHESATIRLSNDLPILIQFCIVLNTYLYCLIHCQFVEFYLFINFKMYQFYIILLNLQLKYISIYLNYKLYYGLIAQ